MNMNNKKLILILTLAIIQLTCLNAHLEEDFDESLFPTIDTTDFSKVEDRNLQQSQERPFKITYDISFFNQLKDNPSDILFKQKVEQVMKIAVDYFSNLLKFIPRGKGQMKWTLERLICGGGNLLARIPEQDKTEDKDSDLHIYLVYLNEPLQEYVAYAGICREIPGSGTTHAQITFNQAWFNKQDLSSAGCDFVLQECDSIKNRNEFCTKETEKPENQCDFYGNGVSNCESGKFLDNNCMQRAVDDRGYCFDPIKNSKSSSLYTTYYGQYFGENSKCFMSTLVQKVVGSTYDLQGSCYKFECIEQSNMLKVWAGNESAICSKNGEKLTFNKYNGYLLCPEKIDQFCQFKKYCPSYCSSNGYCLQGKCVCLKGYSGKSCEIQN
ncbi:hypothetical protein ABPG73_013139 [Tetrahymena malaccensis]